MHFSSVKASSQSPSMVALAMALPAVMRASGRPPHSSATCFTRDLLDSSHSSSSLPQALVEELTRASQTQGNLTFHLVASTSMQTPVKSLSKCYLAPPVLNRGGRGCPLFGGLVSPADRQSVEETCSSRERSRASLQCHLYIGI